MVRRRAAYVKGASNERRPSLTNTGLKKLSHDLDQAEQKRLSKGWSPTLLLREKKIDLYGKAAEAKRGLLYNRCWRWAILRVMAQRWHGEIALLNAMREGKVDAVGNVLQRLSRAHRRLGWMRFDAGEFEVAREHLGQVVGLGVKEELLSAALWRRLARCDVEMFKSAAEDGPSVEAKLEASLAAYRRCLDRTDVSLLVVAQMPSLFVELAEVYERFGAYAGALYFLNMVLEYFPRGTKAFEDAAYRCAHCLFHLQGMPACKDKTAPLKAATELLEAVLGDSYAAMPSDTSMQKGNTRRDVATLLYARVCEERHLLGGGEEGWRSRSRFAFLQIYNWRRLQKRPDAARFKHGPSGAKVWLTKRETWYALALEAEAGHEPTLAVDLFLAAMHHSMHDPGDVAATSGQTALANKDSDDVGMLLNARRLYALLRDPRARQCAQSAFKVNEWDARARRVVVQYNKRIQNQFLQEDKCAGMVRQAWRARVWRGPFFAKVRKLVVKQAEERLMRDRYGARQARSDLAYFAKSKWRPLLTFEDAAALIIGKWTRRRLANRRFEAVRTSRHLRRLGTLYQLWAKARVWDVVARDQLKCLAMDQRTPLNHRAKQALPILRSQDTAASDLARLQRGLVARRRVALMRYVDPPSSARSQDSVASADSAESVASHVIAEDVLRGAAETLQKFALWAISGRRAFGKRSARDVRKRRHAATRLARALKRLCKRRREVRIAAEHFDARIPHARAAQRAVRFKSQVRAAAALEVQRFYRGRRARLPLPRMRAERKAARGLARAVRRSVALRRGLLQRMRLQAAMPAEALSLPGKWALFRALEASRREGEVCAPGMPNSSTFKACCSRTALVADGRVLDAFAMPLFALVLGHWSCALRVFTIHGADLADHANGHAQSFARAIGACSGLSELAILDSSIGSETAAELFAALASRGLSLTTLLLDQNINVWPQTARQIAPHKLASAAAMCLGDYLFVQFSQLLRVAFTKAAIDDFGAVALGRALETSTIQALHLGENRIGDVGAEALAKGLRGNGTLVKLSLFKNRVQNAGAVALVAAVHHRALRLGGEAGLELDLTDNFCDDNCVQHLPSTPALRLMLRGNAFRPAMLQIVDERFAPHASEDALSLQVAASALSLHLASPLDMVKAHSPLRSLALGPARRARRAKISPPREDHVARLPPLGGAPLTRQATRLSKTAPLPRMQKAATDAGNARRRI
ncbi:hypothetical protein M885DRAFT_584218 [Pelagophyceae sp. CCMP2097]|nr:hypothetical protein M885DRAFT_584218 [Pelagophyceae sp. CCMP2097]